MESIDWNDASGHLADQLNRLKLPSQQPDWHLRRANLTSLVDALSPWEIVHVRSLVKNKVVNFSKLTDLPAEVLNLIAESLDLKDIFTCILVSKSWSSIWKQDYVASSLIRKFFPGLVEISVEKPTNWSLFCDAGRRYLRRESVRYMSSLVQMIGTLEHMSGGYFTPDPIRYPSGKYPQRHLIEGTGVPPEAFRYRSWPTYYRNGRIAWQIDPCCVVVDNIYTRHRQICRYPGINVNGYHSMLVSMSGKLLVTADHRQNMLFVYHLDLDEWKKIALPNSIIAAFASDDKVGITVRSSGQFLAQDAYIWQWGDKLLAVENLPAHSPSIVPQSGLRGMTQLGFLFHPLQDDVYYVVVMYSAKLRREGDSPNTKGLAVSVSEHRGGKLTQQYDVVVEELSDVMRERTVTCRPLNTRGGYSICVAHADEKPVGKILHIGFNVLTGKFSVDRHSLPPDTKPSEVTYLLQTCQAWNDQMYIHVPTRDTPFTKNKLVPTTSHIWALQHDSDLQIGHPNVSGLCPEIVAVEGDDTLLVAMTQNGYIVWNFDSPQLMGEAWETHGGTSKV